MTVIDYSTIRTPLRWFAWPTLLSAALLVHFLISVGFWLFWVVGILRNPHMRDQVLPSLWTSLPAFLLCALSAVLFALALRDRSVARRGTIFLFAATVSFFLVDVGFGRWQIYTFIATHEYWQAGGRIHEYSTWWWFNDRWFR